MPFVQSRRHLLTNIAVAGATGFAGLSAAGLYGGRKSLAAEPPPEVTTIRLQKDPVTCIAPQAAEELLRAEGFTDIRYVDMTEARLRAAEATSLPLSGYMLRSGDVDFERDFAPSLIASMEAGLPITILAGLHSGCFEVLGKDDISSIADLKGRAVGVYGSGDERLLKVMASLVGLDPAKDIRWITGFSHGPEDLFIEGKIDAFVALPCQRRRENASASRCKNASGTSTGCPLGLPVFGQLGGVFWRRDSASGWHNPSRPIAMRSMASTAKHYVTQSGLIGPVKVGLPEIMLRLGHPPPRRSRRADAACCA